MKTNIETDVPVLDKEAEKKAKRRELNRRWTQANRDKVNAKNRKWRAENPEKARAACYKWREANRDRFNQINRRSRLKQKAKKAQATEKEVHKL